MEMFAVYDESSKDREASNISSLSDVRRSLRKKSCPGLFHFYSDESTVIVNDVYSFVTSLPVKNQDYEISWKKDKGSCQEKICLVHFGESLSDCRNAQDSFEKLMGVGIPLREAVSLCENDQNAKDRIRQERNKTRLRELQVLHKSEQKPKGRTGGYVASPGLPNLYDGSADRSGQVSASSFVEAIGISCNLEAGDSYDVSSVAPKGLPETFLHHSTQFPEPASEHIDGPQPRRLLEGNVSRVCDKRINELTAELATAKTDNEKGDICLRYAAVFHARKNEQVPLYPGFSIMIGKNERAQCLFKAQGKPERLQRLLLKAIKGENYIATHSAKGQRQQINGLPAADSDLLKAVELFVSFKFRGTEKKIPSITETYNALAGNIRCQAARKNGKYQYPKKENSTKRTKTTATQSGQPGSGKENAEVPE